MKFTQSSVSVWAMIWKLLFTFSISFSAQAMSPGTESFFESLKSPVLEVIDAKHPYFNESLGDYPWYARIIQQEIFKANPSGKPFWSRSECRFKTWQEQILKSPSNFAEFSSSTEKLLANCQEEFQNGPTNILSNTVFAMNLQLEVKDHPFAKHVVIKFPSGIKLKGLLAMKPDGKKRPLIIFRTGIFSNTQEFYPERYLFMMGFEQSPFNMLVVESLSGSEFVQHNNSFSLGGFDEGMQNYWMAREFQNPNEPISKHIQSVHLLGMSMGGHGTMFASLLSHLNESAISSAMAFCPLLNVQDTLDFHQTQGFTMFLMNTWAAKRLEILRDRNPHLGVSTFIEDSFEYLKTNYQESLLGQNVGIKLPADMEKAIAENKKGSGLYWKLNNFWSSYKNVKTPVFIFATKHDPIVSWFINSGRLLDGRLDLSDSNVKLFPFSEAYHCSLSVAYDWEKLATLIQTFYLKNSPGFKQETKEIRIPLSKNVVDYYAERGWSTKLQQAITAAASLVGQRAQGAADAPVIHADFQIPKGEASVRVELNFYQMPRPDIIDRWFAPGMSVSLPLSEMEYPREGVVQSKAEQSLLKRWANQNIQVRIDGEDLIFSWPVSF